jgi:predicted membrane metal-binding protein
MYAQVSHPYLIQDIALWLSFLPVFATIGLIVGARLERVKVAVRTSPRRFSLHHD